MFSPGNRPLERCKTWDKITQNGVQMFCLPGAGTLRRNRTENPGRSVAAGADVTQPVLRVWPSDGACGVERSGRGPLLRVRSAHSPTAGPGAGCQIPARIRGGRWLLPRALSLVNVSSSSLSRAVGLMRVRTAGRRDVCRPVGWSACLWGCISHRHGPASVWTGFRAPSV